MLVFTKDYTYSPDGINAIQVKKGDEFVGQGAHAERFKAHLIEKGILAQKSAEIEKEVDSEKTEEAGTVDINTNKKQTK